ncbi:MAG TPA: alkaline phosphatase family protein [Terriglobales bacterium]|nr:alkaline phosphatase family protein [Terriglobales bacterium]
MVLRDGARQGRRVSVVVFILGLAFTLTGCGGGSSTSSSPETTPPPPNASLNQSVNHIIFMVQENRGFDHYFGKLPAYWAANGFPSQSFDGLPANASNPAQTGTGTISSFHLRTVCVQNMSPGWNESHVDWNRTDPTSATGLMDGFVTSAAAFALNAGPPDAPIFDIQGYRTMGYYDDSDLNYYYFMASNFATSDRWFSPLMSRTQPNRLYLLAATSAGHANPPAQPLSNNTIFGLLESAGISWKIYETDPGTAFLGNFQPFEQQHVANIVPLSQFFTDLQNGTLPAVAEIEPGYLSDLDEHPGDNVQPGAAHVASIINALMASPAWKDSVFILTFDEGGGFYDHVPPQTAVSPDGIPPMDLNPGDICTTTTGPNCDFNHTGFRIPLIVVSPFTKKNYVSHTTADSTAILKLIETRFNLPSLTKRDAAQMDMTEFFDFANPPWITPPSPPAQNMNGLCDFKAVP